MTESARVRSSAANVCASSESVPWRAEMTVCAIWFHVAQIGGFQNRPICVWSGVLVEPPAIPSVCTSLMAAAYWGLASDGGAGGRNVKPRRTTNGRTRPQFVNTGAASAGGGSWEPPRAPPGGEGGGGAPPAAPPRDPRTPP